MRYAVWLACFISVTLFSPLTQARAGWQPLTETIRKSEKDPRQYQSVKLDNGMTVLLVSDVHATKSLAALALPVGSLENPTDQPCLAHYLEHMVLMGSKRYPQPDNLAEFLKKVAEAITPVPRLIAPLTTLRWKTVRYSRRQTGLPMRLLNRCWTRSMPIVNAMR